MPVVKVYNNGLTCGTPPMKNNHKRAIRNEVSGWTSSSSRSNTRFLYSVVPDQLSGFGYAFTFTIKDLPPSPADWEKLRQKLVKRLRRMGFIRLHWLTEWQRRGVPHLHGCVYFPEPLTTDQYQSLSKHWLAAAESFKPTIQGQNIKPITSAIGWLEYLSKHAARGVYHYQRNGKPKEWDKTGRMWGKSGEWPTRMAEAEISMNEFHRLRRMCRSWRIADSRKVIMQPVEGCPGLKLPWANGKRIFSARTCLKHKDRGLSTCLGVSEWIKEDLALSMLYWLKNNPRPVCIHQKPDKNG